MKISTNLGRVSLVPRGEYDPEAQYERLDIVRHDGSSYLALRDLQGVAPEDGADYMLIAERGEAGPQGLVGETGPQGVRGEKGGTGEKGDTGETGNGIVGIERTSGTGAPGTTDTYTITMTDGSTAEFQVYNGADGGGAGDMLKSAYDPQGRNTDIFGYVDEAVKNVKVDVDETPAEGSENPVSSGGTFAALSGKQDALTGQPGQVVGFNAAGSALPVRGWSNPNLLDNWYFPTAINQRNVQSGALWASYSYGIDRWLSFGANVTKWVEGEGIWLCAGDNTNAIIDQRFESNEIPDGTTLTLSALVNDTLISLTFTVKVGEASSKHIDVDGADMILQFTTIYPDTSTYTARIWKHDLDHTVKVTAAKLEVGGQQTLARKEGDTWVLNDPPPNKALELAKCQRHQLVIMGNASYIATGFAISNTRALLSVALPTTMNGTPTMSYKNLYLVTQTKNGGNSLPVASIVETTYSNSACVNLDVYVSSGLTNGDPVFLQSRANDGYLLLDRNL